MPDSAPEELPGEASRDAQCPPHTAAEAAIGAPPRGVRPCGSPSRAEVIGVVLLGVSLLAIAVSLRAAQPGVIDLPWYVCPAAAGGIYVIAALLMAGWDARALIVLALLAAAHVVDAFVIGCAFSSSLPGRAPATLPDALYEGLSAYPPAVVLEVAFVLPLVSLLATPWLNRGPTAPVPGEDAVRRPVTPDPPVLRPLSPQDGAAGGPGTVSSVASLDGEEGEHGEPG